MTFTEIVTEISDRLSLTASDDTARVGRAVNRIYKKITSDLGIKHVAKRATVSATTTQGVSTLTFTAAEKPVNVYNRNVTPYVQLKEYSVDELEAEMPFGASDEPTKYAVKSLTSDTVVILLNCIPQTAFDLYADVYAQKATLSGTDEPAFSESAHDILIHGVLVDEYMKIEKPALSKLEEARYRERMGELRLWVTVSTTRDLHQGKVSPTGQVGSNSVGGSGINGATSYTQTGLMTFDRSAAGDVAPFAVSADADAVVTNLDADKLDGQHGAYYRDAANLNGGPIAALSGVNLTALNATQLTSGTVPDARFPATLPAVSGANLTNLDAADLATGLVPVARIVTPQTTTATGDQNNFDLNGHFTILRCTGAAPAFTGFTVLGAAPAAGDQVVLECLGTSLRNYHQNTGSTDVHRVITASTNGQIVGANGRLLLVYDGTTQRWRTTVLDPGAPLHVAHTAGNFTGSASMTWTVDSADQVTYSYVQNGKKLFTTVNISSSSVGGTPSTTLQITLPLGFVCSRSFLVPSIAVDNGTLAHSYVNPTAGGTILRVFLFSGGNWTAATNTTNVLATCEFEID